MNYSLVSKASSVFVILCASAFSLSLSALAQTDYYFDPGSISSGTGSGGSGTWDTGLSPDWYLPATGDTTFPTGAIANANFDGVGGTVSVVGSVDPANINFNSAGSYIVNAGVAGSIDLGAANNAGIANNGAGDLHFNAPITFSGGTGNISLNVANTSTGRFVFGSTVTNTTASPQFFQLQATSGTIEFNGNLLGANSGFDPNSGSATNDNITVQGGATVLADNGNFNRFQVTGGTLLTNGAITLSTPNSFTSNSGTLGGATADTSTFAGSIANFGGTQTLTSVAGGRVNFSGDLFGGGVTSSNNLVISGGGIIAFTNAGGNDYAGQYNGGDNTGVGTEIKHGTLLAENTQSNTSATGAGWNQNSNATSSVGANNLVQIDNVTAPTTSAPLAVLGGTGYLLQQVVAVGAKSSITPGDISAAGLVTPGTLHLFNGLTAVNGLTANFTLTGTPATSSMVDLGITAFNPQNGNVSNGAAAFALTLNGPVTINLSGPVNTADTYTLFYSATGTAWNIAGASYNFNGVPAGYTAIEQYVANDGQGNEDLNVSFVAVPEPSTWALIGVGALVLVGSGRFRKLRA